MFDFKFYFAWFWVNNGIPYFYPFNPAYLVTEIFFADFVQVRFFQEELKSLRKKKKKMQQIPKLFYHV